MTKIVATFLTVLLLLSTNTLCEEMESVLGQVAVSDSGDNIDAVPIVPNEKIENVPAQEPAEPEATNNITASEPEIEQEAPAYETVAPLAEITTTEPAPKEFLETLPMLNAHDRRFIATVIVGTVAVAGLSLLSIYYRGYLARHRRPPFEAPSMLRCLFPKPVNYEHEITVLCSKYLTN